MLDQETAARFKEALFNQRYHLFAGAGISLDATGSRGNKLKDADTLRKDLCVEVGIGENSALSRAAMYLDAKQKEKFLTQPFRGCTAGPTARAISKQIWRTIFTLNIDDVLEDAYRSPSALQKGVSINFTAPYEQHRDPQIVPIVHLHGFVQQPEDDYVFSIAEYARLQDKLNPWVSLVSELIVSEPFIVTGTRLSEPDIEYFLARRNSRSEVLARAPSFLIEPYPDGGTAKDCERLGLIHVKATLLEFLEWVEAEFGETPEPLALKLPDAMPRTFNTPSKMASSLFWSDFERVVNRGQIIDGPAARPSSFFFGRQPSWGDISAKRDVVLRDQARLIDACRRWVGSGSTRQIICVHGLAGAGKSTSIRRVAYDLADRDFEVLYLKGRDGFDIAATAEWMNAIVNPILLLIDGIADVAEDVLSVFGRLAQDKRVLVLCSERNYRMKHVRNAFDVPFADYQTTPAWTNDERLALVNQYVRLGLAGTQEAVKSPRRLAAELVQNSPAEAVCRILNDFRPMQLIVRSLWNDLISAHRAAYLTVAAAHFCQPIGIRRHVVASAEGQRLIDELQAPSSALQIVEHPDNRDFLVPANGLLAALLVEQTASEKPRLLLDTLVALGDALAPFVNRSTLGTAESRLAARLFDSDGVIDRMLNDLGEEFYERTHEKWKWNSRYWEQRALFYITRDLSAALQYARHGVAIEQHPFPMTTLAKVLFRTSVENALAKANFGEAIDVMRRVIKIELEWSRGPSKTAFWILFDGVMSGIASGLNLKEAERRFVLEQVDAVESLFGFRSDLAKRAAELKRRILAPASP